MSNIFNSAGHKMAVIGDDKRIRNLTGTVLGYITDDDDIHDSSGSKVGYFEANGYVFEGTERVGIVRGDGRTYDEENHYVGKTVGDHIQAGGAALLLLIR